MTGLQHMAGSLHSPSPPQPLPCLRGGGLFHPKPFSAALQLPPAVEIQPRAPPNSKSPSPSRGHRPESPTGQRHQLGWMFLHHNSRVYLLSASERGYFSCSGVKHGTNSWNSHNNKLIISAPARSKSSNKRAAQQRTAPSPPPALPGTHPAPFTCTEVIGHSSFTRAAAWRFPISSWKALSQSPAGHSPVH